MTDTPNRVFREAALRRFAEGRRVAEPLRDISPHLLRALWLCATLLLCGLGAVAVTLTMLLGAPGTGS